jgi:hypothetical protein
VRRRRADRPLDPNTETIRDHAPWLRVSCSRCGRIVEIKKADAIRLCGAQAIWKNAGERLLNETCQQRTGRYEEDGCWPSFDT